MRPFIDEAHAHGELRRELDSEELVDWFMREVPFYATTGPADKKYLIKKFRLFVRPVLAPETGAQSMRENNNEDRLLKLEESSETMQKILLKIQKKLFE